MEYFKTENVTVPRLGLGTARMKGKECRSSVRSALELGYRHIDTAQMYGNESDVGDAIEESSVDRNEVFLVTKLDRANTSFQRVIESTNESLERLGTDYIDLLLVHTPPSHSVSETIEAMNDLQRQEKVRHIGVSNFSLDQLEKAQHESKTPIVTNQVKYNPYHPQDEMLEYCRENGILLTAYSPLELGKVTGDETLGEIGEKYHRSPAQVALRWMVQQDNVAAIPKASRKQHLQENIEIFDFKLSDDEMRRIENIDPGVFGRLKGLVL